MINRTVFIAHTHTHNTCTYIFIYFLSLSAFKKTHLHYTYLSVNCFLRYYVVHRNKRHACCIGLLPPTGTLLVRSARGTCPRSHYSWRAPQVLPRPDPGLWLGPPCGSSDCRMHLGHKHWVSLKNLDSCLTCLGRYPACSVATPQSCCGWRERKGQGTPGALPLSGSRVGCLGVLTGSLKTWEWELGCRGRKLRSLQ